MYNTVIQTGLNIYLYILNSANHWNVLDVLMLLVCMPRINHIFMYLTQACYPFEDKM